MVGGAREVVPACTTAVVDGEELGVAGLRVRCLDTPYHTLGSISYCVRPEEAEGEGEGQGPPPPLALFSGDTLFVGGCGRNFQGTPTQMFHSLIGVLAALPPDTLVYCGHEYTLSNLQWAAGVDPENQAVQRKLAWAQRQRGQGLATVPSTIGVRAASGGLGVCCAAHSLTHMRRRSWSTIFSSGAVTLRSRNASASLPSPPPPAAATRPPLPPSPSSGGSRTPRAPRARCVWVGAAWGGGGGLLEWASSARADPCCCTPPPPAGPQVMTAVLAVGKTFGWTP